MPTPDTSGVPIFADFDMLKAKVNEIVAKYNNLLVNLDSLNVVELTADHVNTGTLDAGKVTIRVDYNTGAYIELGPTGMVINNGSIDTFKVTTGGEVTATAITVQTAAGYPKVVMDPTGDLLGAYSAIDKYVRIDALNGTTTSPSVILVDGSASMTAFMYLDNFLDELTIATNSNIQISSLPGGYMLLNGAPVKVPSWSNFVNNATSQTLQQALDALSTAISGKANAFTGLNAAIPVVTSVDFGTSTSTTATLNFTNGVLTSVT